MALQLMFHLILRRILQSCNIVIQFKVYSVLCKVHSSKCVLLVVGWLLTVYCPYPSFTAHCSAAAGNLLLARAGRGRGPTPREILKLFPSQPRPAQLSRHRGNYSSISSDLNICIITPPSSASTRCTGKLGARCGRCHEQEVLKLVVVKICH